MNIYELAKRLEVITVEDVERYTIIELIYMICDKLNNTTVTLKDLIEVGLSEAVAEQLMKWIEDGSLEEELSELVLKVPYQDYNPQQSDVGYGKSNKAYEGFSSFQKKTYGRCEQAGVVSIMANSDNPKPELLDTDTKGLATYTNRDNCALYVANIGQQAPLTIPANQVVYHANDCVIPSNINMSQFKVGMILDTVGNVNDKWYVGIIKEINGTTLILEDGWYQVRNDGQSPTKGVPDNNLALRVNHANKIWNINSNMYIYDDCPAGANMELGVLCYHPNISDVGGVDIINMGTHPTHYGVKVRGQQSYFNEGFISNGCGRHFVGWTDKPYLSTVPLIVNYDLSDKSEKFSVMSDGTMRGQKVDYVVASSSLEIGYGKSLVIVNGDGVNVTLPKGEAGRTIKIITLKTDTLITAPSGMGIITVDLNQQQISIGKSSGKRMRVIELFSDGGAWYVLNDEK